MPEVEPHCGLNIFHFSCFFFLRGVIVYEFETFSHNMVTGLSIVLSNNEQDLLLGFTCLIFLLLFIFIFAWSSVTLRYFQNMMTSNERKSHPYLKHCSELPYKKFNFQRFFRKLEESIKFNENFNFLLMERLCYC